ncbi:MAG: DUF1616 domain-containing protein [Dehalococcoidia bacterium]
MSRISKSLSIVLALAILVSVVAIVYLAVTPHAGQKYTEFYILGQNGRAEDYPVELKSGDTANLVLGIINHENAQVTYRVEIAINGLKNSEIGPLPLEDKGKWEQAITFMPTTVGEHQQVQFLLFKNSESTPYLSLNLWINVK